MRLARGAPLPPREAPAEDLRSLHVPARFGRFGQAPPERDPLIAAELLFLGRERGVLVENVGHGHLLKFDQLTTIRELNRILELTCRGRTPLSGIFFLVRNDAVLELSKPQRFRHHIDGLRVRFDLIHGRSPSSETGWSDGEPSSCAPCGHGAYRRTPTAGRNRTSGHCAPRAAA